MTRFRAVALVVALAAVWVGAWGLKEWAPFAHEQAAVTWPTSIRPLADFAQKVTQEQFVRPVPVEFIADDDAFAARVADAPLTDDDRHLADTQDAVGRALGMWQGDTSTLASAAAMDASPGESQWLWHENVLVVHAASDADVGPLLRASIVLQLTVALDEQQHQLLQRRADAPDRQRAQALAAVGLGHAVWVHDQYFDSMSVDDKSQYSMDAEDAYGEYDAGLADVPPAFTGLRSLSQRLGPAFVATVDATGHGALAKALAGDTPTAIDQVALPSSRYLRRDKAEHVAAPPVPTGGTLEFHTQAGPFLVYLMVATGMVATDALTVADGWGNDAYTVYRLAGRVCVDMHVVADSSDDAEYLEQGLQAWARWRPAEADALVGRNGTDLYVSVCDPGTEAEQDVPDQNTVDQFFARTEMIRNEVTSGAHPAIAECTATTFFTRYALSDLRAGAVDIDIAAEMDSIRSGCNAQF